MLARTTPLLIVALTLAAAAGCGTNAVEYGLVDDWEAPGVRGVAIDDEQGDVYAGLGANVCEVLVSPGVLEMVDTAVVGAEEVEVLDADGGLVLIVDGGELQVTDTVSGEATDVDVGGAIPVDAALFGGDVAVVVEGCQLVFALDGRSVALPEKACTGELHAGDQLLWHADDGALYAFDAALAITELGSADDIAWHPQSGLWTIAVGTEITARKAGVDLWTWKHTDPLLHVFPLGARIGLWDAGGTVHALDVNGTASTELKWIGTEGEAIGSPDGVSLYIQRENGMLVVTL